MFVADLGRAGLTALIPLSVALGGPTMTVILIVAAPMAILRSFFLAGYTASVPALVGRSQVGSGKLILRSHLLDGVHPRSGDRRRPGHDDRPRPDAWPSTPCRSRSPRLGLLFVRRELRAPVDRPRQPLLTEIREGIDFIVRNPIAQDVHPVLGSDLDPPRAAGHRPGGPRDPRPRTNRRPSLVSSSRPTGSARCSDPCSRLAGSGAAGSPRCSSVATS